MELGEKEIIIFVAVVLLVVVLLATEKTRQRRFFAKVKTIDLKKLSDKELCSLQKQAYYFKNTFVKLIGVSSEIRANTARARQGKRLSAASS